MKLAVPVKRTQTFSIMNLAHPGGGEVAIPERGFLGARGNR